MRSLLQRGWLFIVLGMILGLVAGAALASVLPKSYTAAASVIVTPTGVDDTAATAANGRTSGAVNLDTEAQVVTSTDVVNAVKALDPTLKSVSRGALTGPVVISVPANTTILTISYTAKSPVVAASRANDFASAYISQRGADAQRTLDAQIAKANTELDASNTALAGISNQIVKAPKNSAKLDQAQSNRAVVLAQIKKLTSDITGLRTTAITPGRTLKDAVEPAAASSPSRVLLLSAGLAAGLLLGLIGAWVKFAVRTRLRRPDDVVHHLKLPVLGAIPAARHGRGAGQPIEITTSYRRIANVLLAARPEPGVVLITGQSTTAALEAVVANIARAMSSHGATVAVTTTIDDDEVDARAGHAPAESDVRMATLSANTDRAKLDALRGNGYLLVAGTDPAHSPEVQAIGAASDAVVMVIEARGRTRENIAVLAELDAVGAPMLGAVLVPSARWWKDERAGTAQDTPASSATEPVPSEDPSAADPSSEAPSEEPATDATAAEKGQRGATTALGDDGTDPETHRDAVGLRPARRS